MQHKKNICYSRTSQQSSNKNVNLGGRYKCSISLFFGSIYISQAKIIFCPTVCMYLQRHTLDLTHIIYEKGTACKQI